MAYNNSEQTVIPQRSAKFNSMIAILIRINGLWDRFNQLVLRGNLMGANWVLDRVWGEIVADANNEDKENFHKFKEDFSKINKSLDKAKLYELVCKKEEFLRLLQNKQGKGVAYEESVDDYMD